MKIKLAFLLLLFLLVPAFAKDKNPSDYNIVLTVRTNLGGQNHSVPGSNFGNLYYACNLEVDANNEHSYSIASGQWTCPSFIPGTMVRGKLGSTWGQQWLECCGPKTVAKFIITSSMS
jgi:hypothetical protein